MEKVEQQLGNFDFHKVVVRDEKSGRVLSKNPYRAHIVKGVRYFEHPVGSGNIYFENKQPAGRIEFTAKGEPLVKEGAAHIAWEPPKTQDQTVGEQNAKLAIENEKLLKELAAIKAEQAASKEDSPKAAKKAPAKASEAQ